MLTTTTFIILAGAALAVLLVVKVLKGIIRLALTGGVILLAIWYISRYFPGQ